MKTLLTTLIVLFSLTASAQRGNVALIGGSGIFVGAAAYYVFGEPKINSGYPVQNNPQYNQQVSNDYLRRLKNYQNFRVVGLAFGSACLVSGILIKTIKVTNQSNVIFTASNVSLNYTF